ncbi:MAG: hypothetical protein IKS42_05710 [Oscillospiraceae bacterium]|nr:hypothetical protein [Oscillospiraceae bacterium]
MKKETWGDALDHMSPEFITEAMPRKTAATGKERTMKKDISIVQIVTSIAATAAVVAIVGGSVALISSMKQKPQITPGQEGSSTGDSQVIVTDYVDGSDAVTTTTAETTNALPDAAVVPEGEQNFLGGKGEITALSGTHPAVAYPILRDELYVYWQGYRTRIDGGETEVLTADPMTAYTALLTDGKALYHYDDYSVSRIDSKGNETPFYKDADGARITVQRIIDIGSTPDANYQSSGGWYLICGCKYQNDDDPGSPLAVAYQPATDKTLDLAESLLDGKDTDEYSPLNIKGNEFGIYALLSNSKTVVALPHPDVMTDPLTDWDSTTYTLPMPVPDDAIISQFAVTPDTIRYMCRRGGTVQVREYWRRDGAVDELAAFLPLGGAGADPGSHTFSADALFAGAYRLFSADITQPESGETKLHMMQLDIGGKSQELFSAEGDFALSGASLLCADDSLVLVETLTESGDAGPKFLCFPESGETLQITVPAMPQ